MEKYTELEHNCLKQTIISYQLTFRNKFYYQIAVVVKQTTSYNVLHVCGIILKKEDDTKSIYVLFMIFDPRSSVLALPVFFIRSGYVLSMAIVMKEMTKKRRKNRPRQKDQKGPWWAQGGAFLRPYLYMYTTSQCRTQIIIESCADTVYEAIHIRISMKRLWYKFIFYSLESVQG